MGSASTARPATVQAGPDGTPVKVGRALVESLREEWLVEDRWWTARPCAAATSS